MKRPQHIGQLILKVGKNLPVKNKLNLVFYNKHWKELAGKKISTVSRVVSIKKEKGNLTLIVGVNDSIWLNELNYLKPQFLKKFSKSVIFSKFKNIKFVFDKKKDFDFLNRNKFKKKDSYSYEIERKVEQKLKELNPPSHMRNFYRWVLKKRFKFEKNLDKV